MALSGTTIYNQIAPILQKGHTNTVTYITELCTVLSACVCAEGIANGKYEGVTTQGSPSIGEVIAKFTPKTTVPYIPTISDTFTSWFKTQFSEGYLTWQWVPTTTIVNTPIPFIFYANAIDLLGDLSSVISVYGLWALLSDMIYAGLGLSITYLPINSVGLDGSTGITTWVIPFTKTTIVHNFILDIPYESNIFETKESFIEWLKTFLILTEENLIQIENENKLSYTIKDKTFSDVKDLFLTKIKYTVPSSILYKLQDDNQKLILI